MYERGAPYSLALRRHKQIAHSALLASLRPATLRRVTQAPTITPLQADLIAMLQATRAAERDLFALLDQGALTAPGAVGEWSAKDVQLHLAGWRAIEARRLDATLHGRPFDESDPGPQDPVDDSNAALNARHAQLAWTDAEREADASVDALIAVIGSSSNEILCECDGTTAGIGANGINHAIAHLSDIASLAGGQQRYDVLARQLEAILHRGHLPPRDSGVLLYNLACHHALSGEPDEARRVLRTAFSQRHDLVAVAEDDPDLAAIRDDIPSLASPA